jgi:hypothetical protein
MGQPVNLNSQNAYEITVMGEIDASWLTGFGEVEVQPEIVVGGERQSTLSKIVTDQAGLVGLIRRLHGLGVVLLSIRQVSAADKLLQT